MAHLLKPNQNRLFCYFTGAIIGAIIAFILSIILVENSEFTGSTFLDVHGGSLLTVVLYLFLTGDAQKQIKLAQAEGNYTVLFLYLIAIAGFAPIVNWIVALPFLFLVSPFLYLISGFEIPSLYFIYGGSNMLGFYFLYQNKPSKYDK